MTICDKCGAPDAKVVLISVGKSEVRVQGYDPSYMISMRDDRRDLCDECLKQLQHAIVPVMNKFLGDQLRIEGPAGKVIEGEVSGGA